MAELPESMKTGGFDPEAAASELYDERNRARIQKELGGVTGAVNRTREQLNQAPLNIPTAGLPTPPGGSATGDWTRETDDLTRAEATADQLNAQRNQARAADQAPRSAKQRAKDIKKAGRTRREQERLNALSQDQDYPNPITLRVFEAFAVIAVCQDGIPLLCDFIGIGWIVEYCLLPITWFFYWYLIIRQAPKSMKRKFWQRTLLITCVGWIPVVGQFIPEWTATALGAYIVIAMYQRRKSYEAAGKASEASRGAGSKAAGASAPAPAVGAGV